MPYLPRRYASTQGISPDLTTTPRSGERMGQVPPPYHGSSPGEKPFQKPRQVKNPMISTLSIRDHRVSPVKVYKQLFGKEAERDERTGELVRTD